MTAFFHSSWGKVAALTFQKSFPKLHGMPGKPGGSIIVKLRVTDYLQLPQWTTGSSPALPTLCIIILSETSTVWLSFPPGIPASVPSANPSVSHNQLWLHSSNWHGGRSIVGCMRYGISGEWTVQKHMGTENLECPKVWGFWDGTFTRPSWALIWVTISAREIKMCFCLNIF